MAAASTGFEVPPAGRNAAAAADGHVHIYPFHDAVAALKALCSGLRALDPAAGMGAAFFTERSDCNALQALSRAAPSLPAGMALEVLEPDRALRLRCSADAFSALLLAGRQIAARENIEILALLCADAPFDGQPAEDIVRRVHDACGVPVLAWAPGKWFFGRRRVVERLLERFAPSELLLGDTALRPCGWRKPELFRQAEGMGFRIIAGSDPLPLRGEERFIARYGFRIESGLAAANPIESARSALLAAGPPFVLLGRRASPLSVFRRLLANAAARKREA